jgi:hypothetical protein
MNAPQGKDCITAGGSSYVLTLYEEVISEDYSCVSLKRQLKEINQIFIIVGIISLQNLTPALCFLHV